MSCNDPEASTFSLSPEESTKLDSPSSPKDSNTTANGGPSKTCRVCGDVALNMNFGTVSCESCKAFFRRNALRGKELKCPFQGTCKIDVESRRWCQQCRLRKCLDVGMKKELIQKGKRSLEDPHPDSTSVDLDCIPSGFSPHGSMSSPSPVVSSASSKKRIRKERNDFVSESRASSSSDINMEPAARIMASFSIISSPTPSPESCSSMDSTIDLAFVPGCSPELLCLFERQRIAELLQANEIMMESNPEEEAAAVRYSLVQEKHRLVDVINMTDIAIRRYIKMAKKLKVFKNLLQEDQIALLKGACFEMMILRAVTHYDLEKDCWQGPQATMIKVDVLKEVRGNCYEEIKSFIHSFEPELRKDEPLLLILGAIALFHPNRPSLQCRGQIRAQQSLYYFLLHGYIRAKYNQKSPLEIEALYVEMTTKLELLHLLNDRHISMFMDVNPRDMEPLLIEIFDLKMIIPSKF